MSQPELLPVILGGGNGTRLWPLSRESWPKQFLSLDGSERTMLQQTVLRLDGLSSEISLDTAPIVVCNAAHRFIAAQQLAEVGIDGARIILEPAGRGTAPALTLAALAAIQTKTGGAESDPVLLVMPADHAIADGPAFRQAVHQAWRVARGQAVVTFGIQADCAETGYGYIHCGQDGQGTHHPILSFTEKPGVQQAQAWLNTGEYLWNSGLFVLRASIWLAAIERWRPDIQQACRLAMAGAQSDLDFIRPDPQPFESCPADSIDRAVMERLPADPAAGILARVLPLDAGWSDLGAWDALWQQLPQDEQGNAQVGDTVCVDSKRTMLFSSGRMLAGVGLRDIVVVETADAVLVADRRQTQNVKAVVADLNRRGKSLANTHRKVYRPWGWYDNIDRGHGFQVKRIVVNPGASLSLQMHHHRAEHWIVVSGTAEVTRGDQTMLLAENQSTFIPLGQVHRLANPGKVPLQIIEVQSGSYLGEDDIIRFGAPSDYT